MKTQRLLPPPIRERIAGFPEYRMGVHKVAVRLRDGRIMEDVIVAWEKEIVSVGGSTDLPFSGDDVLEVYDRS